MKAPAIAVVPAAVLCLTVSACSPDYGLPPVYQVDSRKGDADWCMRQKRDEETVMTARQRGMSAVDAEAAFEKHYSADIKEYEADSPGADFRTTPSWEAIIAGIERAWSTPRGSDRRAEDQAIQDAGDRAYLKCMADKS